MPSQTVAAAAPFSTLLAEDTDQLVRCFVDNEIVLDRDWELEERVNPYGAAFSFFKLVDWTSRIK